MGDDIPVSEPQQPDTTAQAQEPEGQPENAGGLPSAKDTAPLEEKFKLTDEIKEQYLRGEKLLGKYDSLEQLIEAHKHIQDKHSQFVEEVKTTEKEMTSEVEKQAQEVKKAKTLAEIATEVLASDMQITEDIRSKMNELGLSETEVKLSAYEAKEMLKRQYEVVGGEEQYKELMRYGSEVFAPEQREAIVKTIQNGLVPPEFRELALLGLKYRKEVLDADKDGGRSQERIMGETTNVSIKPYTDKRELFRDKRYIDSPAGRRDANAQKMYRARLAITPPEVYRGY